LTVSELILSSEDRRKALIRISQFVMRDRINIIRDDLQENIVEMAFYWGTTGGQGVLKDKINDLVASQIYLVQFPTFILQEILDRLVTKNRLMLLDGKYVLRFARRKELEELTKSKEFDIGTVNIELTSRIAQKLDVTDLSNEQKDEVLSNFYSFLSALFIGKSEIVARILTQKVGEVKSIFSPNVIMDATIRSEDKRLLQAQKEVIQEMFRKPTAIFAKFLFTMSQNLVCIQILNLDPECQMLEEKTFSEKILFLDTNLLIALLCPTALTHEVIENLIELTRIVGAQLMVSKRTTDEYLDVLEDANRIFENWKHKKDIRFLKSFDNEFIQSFVVEYETNPSQTWKGYYYRMKQLKSVLKKLKISLYSKILDEVMKHPSFKDVSGQVSTCYQMFRGRPKTVKVAEHDAYHLLLMKELRKGEKPSFLGPNYWFATGDATLYCVDDYINTNLEYEDKCPSSTLGDVWVSAISPFLPLSVREERALDVFMGLLSSQFAIIPFEIHAEDLLEIQGDWIKYDWLDTEDIERILKEEWVQRYIRKARKARLGPEPKSKLEELASVFAKKFNDELGTIRDEKLRKVRTELGKLERRLETLGSEQIDLKIKIQKQQRAIDTQRRKMLLQSMELKSERKYRRRWRTVSGVSGLILIFSYLSLLLLEIVPRDAVTMFCFAVTIVIGAILLYFAIAYERAKVSLGASIRTSPK